jgi:hypothetical protein
LAIRARAVALSRLAALQAAKPSQRYRRWVLWHHLNIRHNGIEHAPRELLRVLLAVA